MEKLILILTGLTVVTGLIKILWNYLYLKLTNTIKKAGRPYKERNADEIIKKYHRIECNKEDLEAVKNSFTFLYRNKKLKRQEILKIKHWIQKNVKYPKKDFNNDIHEIYSALKHGRWDAYDIKVLEDYLMKYE